MTSEKARILKIVGIALGGIVLNCLLWLGGCSLLMDDIGDHLCGTNITQTVFSPDGKYKAVVYEWDCGATTSFSTQVSILKSSKSLPKKQGNILDMDGHPDWSIKQVQWIGNRTLSISYFEPYPIYSYKTKFRDFLTVFDIVYHKEPLP